MCVSNSRRLVNATLIVLASLWGIPQGVVAALAEEPFVPPSDEERKAVAVLVEKGAAVSIDARYQITSVSVSNRSQVTNDDLKHLSSLKSLKSLFISNPDITDGAVEHLRALTQLEILALVGTRVSATAREELAKSLPNCRIATSSLAFQAGNTAPGSGGLGAAETRVPPGTRDSTTPGSRFGAGQDRGLGNSQESALTLRMLESQLRQTAVQDDLKLTAEQKQEISKLTSQAYQQQQALEALRKVLTSDQQARLQQISLQQEGILALARPEVVKELNLSLEQRASIQQFSKVFFEQSSKLSARLRDRSVSIDNYNEEGRRIQTEMNDNILGALTEEQRAAWKAKLGPLLPADNSRPPANPPPTDAQARQAFDLLDSNKDGQLSADEWARSRNVRREFERANIQVEFPLKVETFLNQYRQATTSSQRP